MPRKRPTTVTTPEGTEVPVTPTLALAAAAAAAGISEEALAGVVRKTPVPEGHPTMPGRNGGTLLRGSVPGNPGKRRKALFDKVVASGALTAAVNLRRAMKSEALRAKLDAADTFAIGATTRALEVLADRAFGKPVSTLELPKGEGEREVRRVAIGSAIIEF